MTQHLDVLVRVQQARRLENVDANELAWACVSLSRQFLRAAELIDAAVPMGEHPAFLADDVRWTAHVARRAQLQWEREFGEQS